LFSARGNYLATGKLHPLWETFQQGAVYAVGNVAVKAVGLLLIPLCLNPKFLTVDEFNLWGILVPASQLLIIVVGLGLNLGVLRYYSDPTCIEERKPLVGSVFYTTMLLSTATIVLGLIVTKLVFPQQQMAQIILILLFYIATEAVIRVPLDLLRAQERPTSYTVITVFKFGLTLGLTIYLLMTYRLGLWALLWGQVAGSAIALVILVFLQRKLLFSHPSWNLFRKAMRYGLPLILASISSMLLNMGDRFLIETFMGKKAVGPVAIYTLAGQISGILNMMLVQSFGLVYLVIALRVSNDTNTSKSFYRSTFRIFGLILLLSAMALSILAPEMVEMLRRYFHSDPIYQAAASLVPLITFGYVFFGMSNAVAIGLHLANRTSWVSGAVFASMVFNMGINIFLIPNMGLMGASLATLLGYGLLFIITTVAAERIYPVGYPIAFFMKWSVIAGILTGFFTLWLEGSLWLRTGVKLLTVLGLALVLIIMYRNEIRALIQRTRMKIPLAESKTMA
jgi:O-antigen/teichoic acid export membrane protein